MFVQFTLNRGQWFFLTLNLAIAKNEPFWIQFCNKGLVLFHYSDNIFVIKKLQIHEQLAYSEWLVNSKLYQYKRKTWKGEMIKNILKRRKESDTYRATGCRHHWNRQITMKIDQILELSASTVTFISWRGRLPLQLMKAPVIYLLL